MATLDHTGPLGHGTALRVHVKGAPEALLPLCVTQPAQRQALADAVDSMPRQGLRVLAVARRDWTEPTAPDRDHAEAPGLTLLGLVGLLDPPRPEVAAAAACHTSPRSPVAWASAWSPVSTWARRPFPRWRWAANRQSRG